MPNKPPTLWTVTLARKREPLSRRPVIQGDSVYVCQGYREEGFYESRLMRIGLESGCVAWERHVSHVAGAPVLDDSGVIYWACWDGRILSYSPGGDLLWESEATRHNMCDPVLVGSDELVSCERAGQAAYVQVLNRATGLPRWRVNLNETHGCRPNNFTVAPDHIVILVTYGAFETREEAVIGVRIADGSLAWRHVLPDFAVSPFMWKGAAHITCEGSMHARDPATGEVIASLDARSAPPLIHHGRATMFFKEGDTQMVATYEDGSPECWARKAWQQPVPEAVAATPTLVGGALAVLTEKGLVVLLDPATGEQVGKFVNRRGGKNVGGLAHEGGRLCIAHGRDVICYAVTASAWA